MVPGIVYSWSWTILLDELEMYQFFATLSTSLDKNPRVATALYNMQNKKTGNEGYMAMKLDKSKTYDRVE